MFRKFAVVAVAVVALIGAVSVNTGTADAQAAPPFAHAGSPYNAAVNQTIPFNGSASAGLGLGYTWSFGDGTTGYGTVVNKSYSAPGTYTVTLTVSDAFGRRHTTQTVATIGSYGRFGAYDDCYRVYGQAIVCSWDGSYFAPVYHGNVAHVLPYNGYCPAGYWGTNCNVSYPQTAVMTYPVITAPVAQSLSQVGPLANLGQQTPLSFR